MIPYNEFIVIDGYKRLTSPESSKITGLYDYDTGGIAVGDASEGLDSYNWELTVSGSIARLNKFGGIAISVFTFPSVPIDVAFCFDQSMHPVIAWQDSNDTVYLRRFNAATSSFITDVIGSGKCPRLVLDIKDLAIINESDVILTYIADNTLYYRIQREGYSIPHSIVSNLNPLQRLARIGVSGFRLQLVLTPQG